VATDASGLLEGQAEVVDAVLAASRVFVAVASNNICRSVRRSTESQLGSAMSRLPQDCS
jgi:hypothetical protein